MQHFKPLLGKPGFFALGCFTVLVSTLFSVGSPHQAVAGTLEFHGQNAALFPTANPSDTTLMMNSVPSPSNAAASQQNASNLIQQAVESQISTRIYNDIFNGTATAGSFNLGGGDSISYTRSNGMINLNITDPVNGSTQISLPSS